MLSRLSVITRQIFKLTSFKFCNLKEIQLAKGKLRNQVKKEVKYEYNQSQENIDEEIGAQKVLREKGFQIIDNENKVEIELVKEIKNGKIEVIFCATKIDENDPDNKEEEEDEDMESGTPESIIQKQIQDEESADHVKKVAKFSVDFTVYIYAQNGETICYECNSSDQQININYVSFIYDIEEHKKQSKVDRLMASYNGPIYSTLDERLQNGLLDYLHSFQIDNQLANVIEILAHEKEQKLYVQFLMKLDKFLA